MDVKESLKACSPRPSRSHTREQYAPGQEEAVVMCSFAGTAEREGAVPRKNCDPQRWNVGRVNVETLGKMTCFSRN